MMHDSFHDYGIFEYHDSANQIVVALRKFLERPQVSLVPIASLAQIDDLEQHLVGNIAFDHP